MMCTRRKSAHRNLDQRICAQQIHKALVAVLTAAVFFASGDASAQTAEHIEAYERRIEEQQRQLDSMRRELDALKAAFEKSKKQQQTKKDTQVARSASDTKAPADKKIVLRKKDDKFNLTLSGRVHRMLLSVDDGANSELFSTDSEQGPTMLRLDATGKVDEALSIGATIETGIRQNRPFLISQDNTDAGTDVSVRIAEGFINSTKFGKFSFGRGFASAWLAPEIDLSGTQFANLLPVGMLAPGMKFVDAATNNLSDIQVLTHYVDVERLLLVDRARYDSPSFGPGLQASGSVVNDGRWDLTLRAKPKSNKVWTVVGGGSFQDEPFPDIERRVDAVVSTRHEPTGLNLTVGGSIERLNAGRDSNTYIVKAGWLADLFSIGKTAFSIDYYKAKDLRLDGDKAESFGLFAVQKWPDYGLDFYAGYRRYFVTRPDIDLRDLHIVVMGAALNF